MFTVISVATLTLVGTDPWGYLCLLLPLFLDALILLKIVNSLDIPIRSEDEKGDTTVMKGETYEPTHH